MWSGFVSGIASNKKSDRFRPSDGGLGFRFCAVQRLGYSTVCDRHGFGGNAHQDFQEPRQRIGDGHEDAALRLLRAAGLVLLARNLGCRAGEIDLVMRDGDVLVFVEVRSRQGGAYGGAAASIGRDKQARLARAAAHWLPTLALRHWHGATPAARFDAVVFDGGQVRWLRAAFALA